MEKLIANKELAKNYLSIALKYDDLQGFISGEYELVLKDGYGGTVYSASHVMNALYDYYKNNVNDINFPQKVENAFIDVLNKSCNATKVLNILENVEYYLHSENANKNTFILNCSKILQCLKENLERNKARYTASSMYGPNGAWKNFTIHNDKISEYGFKIM